MRLKLIPLYISILFLFNCSTDNNSSIDNTAELPTLSDITIISVNSHEATVSVSIQDNGADVIISKGFCWSLNSNPTIDDYKTIESSESSNFNSTITNLASNSLYYIRAYAQNSVGISYSEEIIIQTSDNYTLIPDPIFEQKLIDLGHDTLPLDGKALTSNLEEITLLEFEYSDIADLTGIEACVNLIALIIEQAPNLTSIDLAHNTNLVNLSITYTENLNSIDLGDLFFYRLVLSHNSITTLDLSNNSVEDILHIKHTQILNLDLSNLNDLETLAISNNPYLENISIAQNSSLTDISIGINTNLTSLDLSSQPNLINLNVSHNNLSDLNVAGCPQLQYIFSENNQLEELDISDTLNFLFLNCNNNNLLKLNFTSNNYYNMDFSIQNNPNISCIQVNDLNHAYANWLFGIDFEIFSLDCYEE